MTNIFDYKSILTAIAAFISILLGIGIVRGMKQAGYDSGWFAGYDEAARSCNNCYANSENNIEKEKICQ